MKEKCFPKVKENKINILLCIFFSFAKHRIYNSCFICCVILMYPIFFFSIFESENKSKLILCEEIFYISVAIIEKSLILFESDSFFNIFNICLLFELF